MKNALFFSIMLGLALVSLPGTAQTSVFAIPFLDTFESYSAGTALINGTNNGWYSTDALGDSGTNTIVQTNIFSPFIAGTNVVGTKSVKIPIDCTLSNQFTNNAHTNIWLQIDMRLALYDGEYIPEVNTNVAAYFYINSNGYFVVHNGAASPTPTNSTNWIVMEKVITGENAAQMNDTNWARINIRQDFLTKTWDLFVNYVLITNHIQFVNPTLSSLHSLGCYNGSAATTFMDNVWGMTTNPPDMYQHGSNWLPYIAASASTLTCSFIEGTVTSNQTFDVWKTNGIFNLWFSNTVSYGQSWLSVAPATGTSSGSADRTQMTVTYNLIGLPPGTYTGLINVVGHDTTFGFTAGNSPLPVAVSMRIETNIPVLAIDPHGFSQSLTKGSNPTNQTFWIWNNSATPVIPMAYELQCGFTNSTNIFSLSTTNGTSSGEHDPVGIVFADMSSYQAGTYTGLISIRAWDVWPGYMPTGAVILTTNLMVSVEIVVPDAPAGIWASDGTDLAKVIVHWNASTGMAVATYEVWRDTTFDVANAGKIGDVAATNYEDTSASPGLLYYYWVRPVNTYGVLGLMSGYDTGYRALSPPDGVLATDGAYTNRVVVSWSAVNEAASYEVQRRVYNDSAAGSVVFHTAGLEYNDIQVSDGIQYWYQVKTLKGPYSSVLSTGDVGYVLSTPTGVTATKGTFMSRVRVSWNAVAGATEYEVWRNSIALSQSASKTANALSATYDDFSLTPGTVYYYWVKARSTVAASGFSASDSGYAATGAVAVTVWDLVALPTVMPAGSHPKVMSVRMQNNGPSALAAPNTAMGFNFYMGRTTDVNQAVAVGSVNQDVTVAAGTSTVVKVNSVTGVTMPSQAGDYYMFVRAAPVWPNLLADESQGGNITMGVGLIHVTAGGTAHYWGVNDYDGDGISDLAVVEQNQGIWSVQTADGRILGENVPFGGANATPAVGDYDGDGKADPAVYDAANGLWSVMLSGSGYLMVSAKLGAAGYDAMPGDYDGDGKADPVVYNEFSGMWEGFLSGSGYAYAAGQFGAPGYRPVPGDYNGDGIWDMAMYHEASGYWFIRTPGGELLKWGEYWGSPGHQAVSGDYDGDGIWDLAVYSESTGYWYVRTMSGTVLAMAKYWGSPGYIPVPGDYNGDGIWDLAVYHTASGYWYAVTLQGQLILFNNLWGSSASRPVKW